MASELQRYSVYYDRKTASDIDYRQYMEKRAAVTDLSTAVRENANRQIVANTVNSALLAGKIDQSMMRMQTGIQTAIKAQTYTLVASQVALGRTFQQGFDKINNTLDMGFSGISGQLGSLSAAFNIGLARLESSINKMSKDICDRLDALHNILNNPLLTQSRELYRRALVNYNKGFYEEALEDIKAAVEKNKTDYISWFLMGKVYLFGASEFSNVIDLDQAIDSFTNAAKYISPDIATSGEAKLLASEIWFYLGLAKLTKSNNLLFSKQGDESKTFLRESQQAFERSYIYSDNMLESLYNVARCKVLSGDLKGAVENLRSTIKADKTYAIKTLSDPDFESITNEFNRLIHELRIEIFEDAKKNYEEINRLKNELFALNKSVPSTAEVLTEFQKLFADWVPADFQGDLPYFDIRDSYEVFPTIKNKLLQEVDRLTLEKNKADSTNSIQQQILDEIEKIKKPDFYIEKCEYADKKGYYYENYTHPQMGFFRLTNGIQKMLDENRFTEQNWCKLITDPSNRYKVPEYCLSWYPVLAMNTKLRNELISAVQDMCEKSNKGVLELWAVQSKKKRKKQLWVGFFVIVTVVMIIAFIINK